MAMRQATVGSLAKRSHLREHAKVSENKAKFMEAHTMIGYCKMARKHEMVQHALSAATQLSRLAPGCKAVGIDISGVAALQVANVLWEDGQGIPSIKMLQDLEKDKTLASQSIVVKRAKLLAKLGSHISKARLDKPDRIMSLYLEKAISELKTKIGPEAGRVYHEFAFFCDQQLENPNNIADYECALKLRNDKKVDVEEYEALLKAASKDKLKSLNTLYRQATSWLKIYDQDFNRLEANQKAFLKISVLNYLNCLLACDNHDGDAVRFATLWMSNSQEAEINEAVSSLHKVPSKKFAPLMNQLSSRLSFIENDQFQLNLMRLIKRICDDHPYHGIYQLLALIKSKPKSNDVAATMRYNGAHTVAKYVQKTEKSTQIFDSILSLTYGYNALALAKPDSKKFPTTIEYFMKLNCRKGESLFVRFETGPGSIASNRIAPPTKSIELRADRDYSKVPTIIRYDPKLSIAQGLSAPKIIKVFTSDGNSCRELVGYHFVSGRGLFKLRN